MPENRPPIFHPFLFVLYPSLFFYDLNKHELWLIQVLAPAGITLILTCLFLALFTFLLRKIAKAGIFTSFFIILFFFYEAILNQLSSYTLGKHLLNHDPALFWSYGIFLLILFTAIKYWKRDFSDLTRFLNIVSLILIFFPLASLGTFKIQSHFTKLEKSSALGETLPYSKTQNPKRDIYYIIVDAYTSGENLKNFWGYDNKEFFSYLKQKGFYVAHKSRSNYQHTGYSMPSALNMQFIHDLAKNKNGKMLAPHLDEMWNQNKVARFLKSIGYSYVIVGDWLKSDIEDLHFTYRKIMNRYVEYLADKTWLKSLNLIFFDHIIKKRKTILYGFKRLEEIPDMELPTFTYAHIMIPHPSFVFDREGNIPKQENLNSPSIVYPDQVAFTNKKLMAFIDKALSKSKPKPIIVIQGDHGFEVATGLKPDENGHRKVFGILNAYFLPQNGSKKLYDTITPVNTFRVIFNHYFGTNLKLLPDKSYFRFNYSDSWSFIQIPNRPESIKDPEALAKANNKWIESLEKYVEENPDFYDSRIVLGWNYHLVGQNSKAIEELNKAIEINPGSPMAHKQLGIVHYNLHHWKEAEKSFLKFIDIGKFLNPNTIFMIGKIYFELKQFDKALKYLNELSQQKNRILPEVYNYIAMISHRKKDFEGAETNWKLAIAENPDFFQYYRSLANLYFDNELYEKSLIEYEKSIAFNPKQPRTLALMGLAHAKLNQFEQASKMFNQTLKFEPNNQIALSGLNFLNTFNKSLPK